MKMLPLKKTLFCAVAVLLFSACSNDEDAFVTTENLEVSIAERSEANTVIGTVTAEGNGTLTYDITSQSVQGAMAIDENTGELTILDASVFDYETVQSITAVVTVANGAETATSSVTVTITDVDDLWWSLSDSRTAYENAAFGTWINVTAAEYNNIVAELSDVSGAGMSDEDLNGRGGALSVSTGANNWTISHTGAAALTIPNGGYVFAFKFYSKSGSTSRSGDQVKVSSEAANSGFENLGSTLPATSEGDKMHHFVYKGSSTKTTAEGYLAFYSSANIGYVNYDDMSLYGKYGNSNTLTTSEGIDYMFQALASTTVQWEVSEE